ncbi:sugar ABC transporter ATP-binding protein [Mucilaginibacter limnophilus]|uniref:Sugar ABC transporter ATP-binding protein n=1 Tax=Mucilaginibacter limnophilus TaxID=1932778 RepID=A0A437MZ93_9SPHI|nr:sugar ABC transporter ATP-binding protein [Mucilaginibacter limnophilus]RVU02914.1 sugar ABC transporter ATP-binding protein [Mucilaginibacter limnophilus]
MIEQQTDISIEVRNITKTFPGVKALSDVNLSVAKGTVHALCGENGAGKSTLMKILTGNYQPDGGRIFINGKETVIKSQKHARDLGIGIVYQERSLVKNLSVAENIFTGNEPRNQLGFIKYRELFAKATVLLKKLNININPQVKVATLSPGLQQMVEIAKALSQQPRVLILDEPTASITETETKILFEIILQLKKQGTAIIYISHRMTEIFKICDVVSILKDGCYQGTYQCEEITIDDVIKKMVGREMKQIDVTSFIQNETAIEVRNASGNGFSNISFSARKGEIIGITGLVGAGRTELVRAIFGADELASGEVYLNGAAVSINHPSQAIKNGIAYLPEERKEQGLFMDMGIADNIISGNLSAVAKHNLLNKKLIKTAANSYVRQLAIKTPSVSTKVANLSGGNQQKVVLARWLALNPTVFIVDEPTHGVDIGAKYEIYQLLQNLAKTGSTIILISSELPEVLALSDRILLMYKGTITGCIPRLLASEELIMEYASGLKKDSAQMQQVA